MTQIDYLQLERGGVLCAVDGLDGSADASDERLGVIVVPPFGWEEIASYRERLLWARDLAAQGHVVARLDLPGTGDSDGGAMDPQRLGRWVEAVDAVAARLRALACRRVAAIGLGLGGLVAVMAASAGAPIDDLVLWAVPGTGATFVRGQRALARMQRGRTEDDEVRPPEGVLDVDGVLLNDELLASLRAIDLKTVTPGGASRALLVGGGAGATAGEDVAEAWRSAGLDVEVASGAGYEAMVEHPQFLERPTETMALVGAWLRTAPAARDATRSSAAPEVASELALGDGVTEQPLWVENDGVPLFGILTLPAAGTAPDTSGRCGLFINAGALRRTGPNRMYVDAARRWARAGVPSLRIDLPGIGDSGGGDGDLRDLDDLFAPDILSHLRAFTDALVERTAARRVVAVGLCSGATHAMQAAAVDERFAAVGMLNAGVLAWHPDASRLRQARRFKRVLSAEGWRSLVKGDMSIRAIGRATRDAASLAVRRPATEVREGIGGAPAFADFATLDARGVPVFMGFARGEALRDELADGGLAQELPRIAERIRSLPGADHELRSWAAQVAAHQFVDDVLAAAAES